MDSKTLKRAIAYAGLTKAEMAGRMGVSAQNIQNKMARGTLREADYRAIAKAMGAAYVTYFLFPDGTTITPEADEKAELETAKAGNIQIDQADDHTAAQLKEMADRIYEALGSRKAKQNE